MLLTKNDMEEYEKDGDIIDILLDSHPVDSINHKWMKESLPKRVIYNMLYKDLILESGGKSVLDIGGGYNGITNIIASKNDYTLLDICDSGENIQHIQDDWYRLRYENGKYDIIIANDIFPNVDQRLEPFLYYFLSKCKEMRLSLTYYNKWKYYQTKRTDGDEIFYQLSYNGRQTKDILDKFFDRSFEALLLDQPSLFLNGRQIYILKEKGKNDKSR